MSKPTKPKAMDFANAARILEEPAPPRNWFSGRGQCENAPLSEHPEEFTGLADMRAAATIFVGKYCGHCIVAVECARAMLDQKAKPEHTVYGGFMPADATRVWEAGQAIVAAGGLEAALQKSGITPPADLAPELSPALQWLTQ